MRQRRQPGLCRRLPQGGTASTRHRSQGRPPPFSVIDVDSKGGRGRAGSGCFANSNSDAVRLHVHPVAIGIENEEADKDVGATRHTRPFQLVRAGGGRRQTAASDGRRQKPWATMHLRSVQCPRDRLLKLSQQGGLPQNRRRQAPLVLGQRDRHRQAPKVPLSPPTLGRNRGRSLHV